MRRILLLVAIALSAAGALAAPAASKPTSQKARDRRQNFLTSREIPYDLLRDLVRTAASQGFTISKDAYIVDSVNEYYSPTDYSYYAVLSDGTAFSQQGGLNNNGAFYQKGFYSFVSDNSRRYTTNYNADERGYQPNIKIEEPGELAKYEAFCQSAACGG